MVLVMLQNIFEIPSKIQGKIKETIMHLMRMLLEAVSEDPAHL